MEMVPVGTSSRLPVLTDDAWSNVMVHLVNEPCLTRMSQLVVVGGALSNLTLLYTVRFSPLL
jgi:hypothetical protein